MTHKVTQDKAKLLGDNCVRLSYHMYIVRTQAGFEKALMDFWKCSSEEFNRREIKEGINKFPIQYPVLISLYGEGKYNPHTDVDIAHPDFAKVIIEDIENQICKEGKYAIQ